MAAVRRCRRLRENDDEEKSKEVFQSMGTETQRENDDESGKFEDSKKEKLFKRRLK